MKNLNYLNYFFVGLPITLCLIGLYDEDFLFFGILSTILTGAYHVITGIQMLIDQPKDRNLQIYITAVILFFALWFMNGIMDYNDTLTYILIAIPPILAIYFSTILYKKAKH